MRFRGRLVHSMKVQGRWCSGNHSLGPSSISPSRLVLSHESGPPKKCPVAFLPPPFSRPRSRRGPS